MNLERAAKVGDRLGGHIVQGHVDGVGTLLQVRDEGSWRVLRFSLPDDLAPLVDAIRDALAAVPPELTGLTASGARGSGD